jgi:hypothetical protein
MKLLDFLYLPTTQRFDTVVERGIMLERESDLENTFLLFYFSDFFVEISINSKKEIIDIIPYKTGYTKEKYFDKLN